MEMKGESTYKLPQMGPTHNSSQFPFISSGPLQSQLLFRDNNPMINTVLIPPGMVGGIVGGMGGGMGMLGGGMGSGMLGGMVGGGGMGMVGGGMGMVGGGMGGGVGGGSNMNIGMIGGGMGGGMVGGYNPFMQGFKPYGFMVPVVVRNGMPVCYGGEDKWWMGGQPEEKKD